VVTDPSAPPAELAELRRLGLEVVIAERAMPARLESVDQATVPVAAGR